MGIKVSYCQEEQYERHTDKQKMGDSHIFIEDDTIVTLSCNVLCHTMCYDWHNDDIGVYSSFQYQ